MSLNTLQPIFIRIRPLYAYHLPRLPNHKDHGNAARKVFVNPLDIIHQKQNTPTPHHHRMPGLTVQWQTVSKKLCTFENTVGAELCSINE